MKESSQSTETVYHSITRYQWVWHVVNVRRVSCMKKHSWNSLYCFTTMQPNSISFSVVTIVQLQCTSCLFSVLKTTNDLLFSLILMVFNFLKIRKCTLLIGVGKANLVKFGIFPKKFQIFATCQTMDYIGGHKGFLIQIETLWEIPRKTT